MSCLDTSEESKDNVELEEIDFCDVNPQDSLGIIPPYSQRSELSF